ncbi:hypothetical protein NST77_17785 [Niallia sp. FSL W8-0177]|jgi:hypothetical protein|uniref:hypothetical protein n=1 Tax=Niallia sp. FSL W8-0177 TaxID=2954522 RepID=UPI0030F77DDA
MFFLKDDGFGYSKTQLKTEVIDIHNLEDGFTQLQLRFTFDFNSGAFSHEVTWSNYDIESSSVQIGKSHPFWRHHSH